MVRKRQEERQEGDQETLCGDPSSPPGEQRPAQEEEATPDPDSSSPSPDPPPPPHQVSTSSQKKERLTQVVIRWMETNEEVNDPDQGQTPPDRGRTAPDRDQTAPDRGQTAPDRGQTPGEPEPQHQGEGSGPLVAWLHQTADGPPRKDLAQVVGNLKVRVKGVRKLRAETETMDPGQTAQDPNQLPNVPDSPPTKALAQVMGNLRFRVKGLKKKRVQPATTSRLDEEKPLGRPSGRSPSLARPPRTKTRPPRTKARPPRTQARSLRNLDLVIEAEEEGEATAQAEGTGLRPRVNKWLNRRMKEMSTFAARFQCGSCVP
ncbi:unnamed protein product [Gadus morhua 'NCC']